MVKKTLVILSVLVAALALVSCGGDPYETSIYSEQPNIVTFQDYLAANADLPQEAIEAILAGGTEKSIIKKSGLFFKDSDGDGKLDPYEDWRLTPAERAADLISQMTPEQKLGLLNFQDGDFASFDEGYAIPGLNSDGTAEDDSVASYMVAGYRHSNTTVNSDIPAMDWVKYFNNVQGLVEQREWGIPYFFAVEPGWDLWFQNDLQGSGVSPWPYPMGLGSIDDLGVTKKFGEILRQEIRMSGRHGMFGPQADLATEPRWARVQHAIHSDSDIVSSHIEVLVKAMQGFDLDKNDIAVDGAVAIVKHFPGSGSVEEGMDSHTYAGRYSLFSEDTFEDHMAPFEAAIVDAKAGGIMTLYSIINIPEYQDVEDGEPAWEGTGFNKTVVTDLLRNELGFDGAIVTDSSIVSLIPWGNMDKAEYEQIAEILEAGVGQYVPSDKAGWWAEAYEKGLITDEMIDDAARHSVTLQFELGLFENPYVDTAEAEEFWAEDGRAMQGRVAAGLSAMRSAMVLMENPDVAPNIDILPISATNKDYVEAVDTNGNGTVDIYFDSAYPDADSGQAATFAKSTDGKYLSAVFVDNIADADIAIVRIYARGGTYFGSQGGIPLDYETPAYVFDRETQSYTDEEINNYSDWANWTFGDWSSTGGAAFVNQGYRTYLGYEDSLAAVNRAIAAKQANPDLKIILGLTATRPAIVTSFIDDIDGFFVDFAATDEAFLDVVFWQDGVEPKGHLPIEFPRDNASVEAQLEDVAGDTANPLYEIGYGLEYNTGGGYGN